MSPSPGLTVALVAGEASGDNLGAPLLRELRRQVPDARFVGIGGPAMIDEGLESWFDIERLSVNGFVDPIKRLPELLDILLTVRRRTLELRPDCFVGVDFNFFNLLLERTLKRNQVPTVHYVSPTVWAWRQWRINSIRRSVDLMLCLYPFETDIYKANDIGVEFVGHPKAREIARDEGQRCQGEARTRLGLGDGPLVAILPGSRSSEVGYSGPDFLAAAAIIKQSEPDCRFVIPAANSKRRAQIEALLAASTVETLVLDGDSRLAMTAADVVLVNSGTATLEAMLLKKPMVMSYRLGNMTYQLVSRLVSTEFFALPNILAGRALVPEYIQHEATPGNLAGAILSLLREQDQADLLGAFDAIHAELGIDAGTRAADAVLKLCRERHVLA